MTTAVVARPPRHSSTTVNNNNNNNSRRSYIFYRRKLHVNFVCNMRRKLHIIPLDRRLYSSTPVLRGFSRILTGHLYYLSKMFSEKHMRFYYENIFSKKIKNRSRRSYAELNPAKDHRDRIFENFPRFL